MKIRMLPFSYAARNLGRSPLRTAATIIGCTLVVLVLVAAAAFVQAMQRSLTAPPGNRNMMLIGAGSEESVERSQISTAIPSQARAAFPGIRERLGVAYLSPEVHMALISSRPERKEELRAMVRGVTETAMLVHQTVQIEEGAFPRAGHNEIMAGRLAADKMGIPKGDLAVGKNLVIEGHSWTVVGLFHAPGTVMDSELWAPLTDLQVATQRDSLSAVILTLEKESSDAVKAWAATRLDLELVAVAESDYYSSLRRLYLPIQATIVATAILISLAGILGGFNTLYVAFAARIREVGMLQSLGFSREAILIGLIQESLLAAITGALIGCGLGRVFLHGHAVSFSMGAFSLQVDEFTVLVGVGCGILLGIAGTIPPAVRCMVRSIAESLRK